MPTSFSADTRPLRDVLREVDHANVDPCKKEAFALLSTHAVRLARELRALAPLLREAEACIRSHAGRSRSRDADARDGSVRQKLRALADELEAS